MSGQRVIVNEGYPGDYRDVQRLADAAAKADDVAWGALAGPGKFWTILNPTTSLFGQTDRMVMPLREEGGTDVGVLEQLLVIPSSTPGQVTVLPAAYQQAGDGQALDPNLTAKQLASLDSALFAANASGLTRIDLVYASIARSVTVTGSRKKRAASGISTQTLDLASDPTVTIAVVAGTPGAGLPALPADTATSWNFALAAVTLLNGYALNGAITADKIQQLWIRGGVHQEHMRPIIGGDALVDATLLSARITPRLHAYCPVVHNANPTTKVLLGNKQYDMRQRVIRVVGVRPKLDTSYKAPKDITKGGSDTTDGANGGTQHAGSFDTGLIFTGTDGDGTALCYKTTITAGASGGNLEIDIWADKTSGILNIKFVGAPWNVSDAWWVEVEFSGQLKSIV